MGHKLCRACGVGSDYPDCPSLGKTSPPPPPPSVSSPEVRTLQVSLYQGWTWISLNVELADMSVRAVMGDLPLQAEDMLKSQGEFTNFYAGYGFYGTLAMMSTSEMFALKLSTAATLQLQGTPVSLPKSVTLNSGWTWLSHPYATGLTLRVGAPDLEGGYAGDDQYKSQFSFAQYYAGYGWYGTLTTLEPGAGYRVKIGTGGRAVFKPSQP